MARKIEVEIVGDARKLNRALKQSETATKKWARTVSTATGPTGVGGGLLGFAKAGGFAAAAGAGVLALKKITDAARESQLIVGQTSVAVENAGLSWGDYADEIQSAALQLSRVSAFDDEDILKSFSVFVRGNKNVAKSIDLAALAADVARGRYTDLESATQLVNKAAMGQVGALRRAGIQIDSTATSTEALAILQQRFAGAAQKYADSSVGAADRLRVSWGNLLEDLGKGTDNQVSQTQTSLARFVEFLDRMVQKNQEVQQSWQDAIAGYERVPDFTRTADAFDKAFGLGKLTRQPKAPIPFGQPGFVVGKAPPVPLGPSVKQRNQWFDTDITRRLDKVQDVKTLRGQVDALGVIAGLIRQRLAITKDITRRLSLEDQLRAVNRQRSSLTDQMVADAAEAKKQAKALAEQTAALKLAQRTAREFRALGLTATGGEPVPGADNLRKQLAQLSSRSDIGALPKKLAESLARVRKLLKKEDPTREIRDYIQSLFTTIREELNKGDQGGPLTKTTQLSERILAGLGLSASDARILRARLSHFNSGGTALAGTGTGSSVNMTSYTVIDGKVVASTSSKYNRRTLTYNVKPRNGPNAGGYVGA